MEDTPEFDWSKLPESLLGKSTGSADHAKYESLEEGRIPVPIPFRVKSGSANSRYLLLQTAQKTVEIQWSDVEMLALGIIKYEATLGQAPKSRMRRVLRQVLLGDPEKINKGKSYNLVSLLDVYVKGYESPFRIDQGLVNYRGFLNSPGYVSKKNFRNLVNKIVYFSENARLDPCLVDFLGKMRKKLTTYESIYDFQSECQVYRTNLTNLVPRVEVDVEIDEIEEI